MFYRVTPRGEDGETIQCFKVSDILETARKVIQINLLTVSLLMTMLPYNMYNMVVYFTDIQPSHTLDKVLACLQIPFMIIFPIAIHKKLLKSSQNN